MAAQTGSPSNFVPELSLSYTDPASGERVECGQDCRRFTMPAGAELEVRVQVRDQSGARGGDGVTWDLWFNQPNPPFPRADLAPCRDATTGRYDRGCRQAMEDEVDLHEWDTSMPDAVCVPGYLGGSCWDNVVRVTMDPDFGGVRRRGVYHVAVWVNRFSSVPEEDEFDNFAGPVRVTVEPRQNPEAEEADQPSGLDNDVSGNRTAVSVRTDSAAVVVPSSVRPYAAVVVPEQAETSFTLSSQRSEGILEFAPAGAGRIEVEVIQTGMTENMVVQVRKVSTGEVLIETRGKGVLRLEGGVDNFQLMDDNTFEVVVTPGQGSRGIRGSMRVTYPARIRYMVDQPKQG